MDMGVTARPIVGEATRCLLEFSQGREAVRYHLIPKVTGSICVETRPP